MLLLDACAAMQYSSVTQKQYCYPAASNFSQFFSSSFQICISFLQSLNCFTPQVLQIPILSIMITAAI